ncbi:MAG: spore coat protein CotH, partial [Epulopiscium sp.]|nr:spore coat protein CotH [Candidatus Epulonipiscium sp.]
MLDNATAKEYISGDLVINGVTFSTVGIRTKGNSSLSQVARMEDSNRYSLQFKFNYYVKGQTCYGLDSFCINNVIGDTTYMKDYIAYDIMKYIGVDTPLTNYANVTVNGEDFGFYLALERYNKSFLDRVYNTSGGQLYNVKIAMGQEENFMQANTGQNEGIPNNRTNQHNQFEQRQGGQQRRQRNNQNGGMGGELPIGGIDEGFPAGGMGGISGRGGGSLLYTDDNIINYSAIFDNSVFSKNSD